MQSALVIYHIAADGSLRDSGVIKLQHSAMIHDFMVTQHHLVLILPPYNFEQTKDGSFLNHFNWQPELGGRALIIDKNDFQSN